MRVVEIGTQRFTQVLCLDEPGAGNACHEYVVRTTSAEGNNNVTSVTRTDMDGLNFAKASFQNGPIGEAGVNGCHNEDLIAIVIDRLQGFQSGDFACRENSLAITKLEEAMHWLNHRTQERQRRGVEGMNQI